MIVAADGTGRHTFNQLTPLSCASPFSSSPLSHSPLSFFRPGVFCGHVHWEEYRELAGVPLYTTPSTSSQYTFSLDDPPKACPQPLEALLFSLTPTLHAFFQVAPITATMGQSMTMLWQEMPP